MCLCMRAFVGDCNSCWGGGKDFGVGASSLQCGQHCVAMERC